MSNEFTRSQAAAALYNAQVNEKILRAARAANIMINLATRKLLDDPGPVAATFSRFNGLTADSLSEATDSGDTQVSLASGVTITADLIGLNTEITDKLKSTGVPDLTMGQQDEMGRAVATKIDTDLCALFSGFSNQVGTTNTAWSTTVLNAARFTLDDANAPNGNTGDPTSYGPTPNGLTGKIFVGAPIHLYYLREQVSTSSAAWLMDAKAADIVYEDGTRPAGFVGSFMGIPMFESTNVPSANTDADRVGGMFVPSAVGIVVKWLSRLQSWYDVRKRDTVYGADAFYGVGELVDAYGVGVLCKAS